MKEILQEIVIMPEEVIKNSKNHTQKEHWREKVEYSEQVWVTGLIGEILEK